MRDLLKQMPEAHRIRSGLAVRAHIDKWLRQALNKSHISVAFFAGFADEIGTDALDALLMELGADRFLPFISAANELTFCPLSKMQTHYSHVASSYDSASLTKAFTIASAPDQFDLIFVPGLAFDRLGHRLGRGKGYYDRALSKLRLAAKRPLFIGLAMDEQVVSEVPFEEHDVSMDFLCTPSTGMLKIV